MYSGDAVNHHRGTEEEPSVVDKFNFVNHLILDGSVSRS